MPTENSQVTANASLGDYCLDHVQRWPAYAVKDMGGRKWKTIKRPLNDNVLLDHLEGRVAVAGFGQWYPSSATLDIDDRPLEEVEEIRERLGMNEHNSFLDTSESANSYYIRFRPTYHGRPPTLRLLEQAFVPFAESRGIEVFPRRRRKCRLPFSPIERCLDLDRCHLVDWAEKQYWWGKLDEYEVGKVPRMQLELDLLLKKTTERVLPLKGVGKELLKHGLQAPHSRHDSQFAVAYYLWRTNYELEDARRALKTWIRKKHNGYSQDILARPEEVDAEIDRQTCRIWSTYGLLPDSAAFVFDGWLTANDLPMILHHSDGSLPKARFLFNLLRYCYPRRLRPWGVNVHRDVLTEWASYETYLKRLRELERAGLLTRSDSYLASPLAAVSGRTAFAKAILLRWPWSKDLRQAVTVDDRPAETLEQALVAAFPLPNVRGLLVKAGMRGDYASRYTAALTPIKSYQCVRFCVGQEVV